MERFKLWTADGVGHVRVPYLSLILVAGWIGVAVFVHYGVGVHDTEVCDSFVDILALRHIGQYKADILMGSFIPRYAPIIFRLFPGLYSIPLSHFIVGVLAKSLIICSFLALSWRLTRSVLASCISLLLVFKIFDLYAVILNMPIGAMTDQIRFPLYFSYRQIAIGLALAATAFFLDRRYVISSILLACGLYVHPHNTMAFFLSLGLGLAIFVTFREDKSKGIHDMVAFAGPFLLLVAPFVLMNLAPYGDSTPMSSVAWWKFILKNEPDDASILYRWRLGHYGGELILTCVAVAVYAASRLEKPVAWKNLMGSIRGKEDVILPVLAAPWIMALFAMLWEASLVYHFPDAVNDVLIQLQIRRYPTVSAMLYIPILSGFLAKAVFVVVERSVGELINGARGRTVTKLSEWVSNVTNVDKALAVALAICAAGLVGARGMNVRGLHKFLSTEHKDAEYFNPNTEPIYGLDDTTSAAKVIPLAALLDTCRWIKANTSPTAAFFTPSYIKEFRPFCERQVFLAEKLDGTVALFNRRFATAYLERFKDIHKGLTYEDLPGIVFEGGEPYAIMRQRYLGLNGSDVEYLRRRYPGYGYFLTEVGHRLPYRTVCANAYFLVYDLSEPVA